MMPKRYNRLIMVYIRKLQKFTNRIWYLPLISFLTFLDAFIFVIPTDSIVISSALLSKKRWFAFALSAAIGTVTGGLIIAYIANHYGLHKILEIYPGIDQTHIWKLTFDFFHEYGLIVVFIIGLLPISQQPALVIAGLSSISFISLLLIISISHLIKFSTFAYIASHAPRLLDKLWGLKEELRDSGIKTDQFKN